MPDDLMPGPRRSAGPRPAATQNPPKVTQGRPSAAPWRVTAQSCSPSAPARTPSKSFLPNRPRSGGQNRIFPLLDEMPMCGEGRDEYGALGRSTLGGTKSGPRARTAPDPRSLGWALRDSNPQPRDYESPALTVAPRARYEKGGDRSRRQQILGGDKGVRTPDLVTASHALSQLSYIPVRWCVSYINRLAARVNTQFEQKRPATPRPVAAHLRLATVSSPRRLAE